MRLSVIYSASHKKKNSIDIFTITQKTRLLIHSVLIYGYRNDDRKKKNRKLLKAKRKKSQKFISLKHIERYSLHKDVNQLKWKTFILNTTIYFVNLV